MHKTVYIEKDEEITSIVSKIKRESGRDIFLVVPKGALLTQGMINLKLLKKEADRMDKELFLITGDEKARRIIAKVGLKIGEIEENTEGKKAAKVELFSNKASEEALNVLSQDNFSTREIGSASFFEEQGADSQKSFLNKRSGLSEELHSKELREMLYNQRKRENISPSKNQDFQLFPKKKFLNNNKKLSNNDFETEKELLPSRNFSRENFSRPVTGGVHLTVKKETFHPAPFSAEGKTFPADNFLKAEEFFLENKNREGWRRQRDGGFLNKGKERAFIKKDPVAQKTGRAKWFLLSLFGLFLLSFAGWAYWNWPKVSVKLYPRVNKVDGSLKVKVLSEGDYVLGNGEIKGMYHEFLVEKVTQNNSSGSGTGSVEGKATGKVTILNKYSQSPQSLVATTRLLSKEGKLFRLTKDIVVPGMNGEIAGKVEASVIADKSGADFNIGPTTFTIEGFKGSPKYEKFEVQSNQAMTGGGTADDQTDQRIVLQRDIDEARIKTIDELGRDLGKMVAEKIGNGRKYFLESAGKEIIEAFADRRAGELAEIFNYTVKEKIKLISFDERELENLVYEKINQDLGEDFFIEKNKILINFDKPIIDWDKRIMEVLVNYEGNVSFRLDIEKIKKEVLGKNESEIKDLLLNYKQLEKAELGYYPSWTGRWPVLERNLTIIETKKEEN